MARRETLAQAKARMRREGYSEKQITGQVHRWHPSPVPLSSGLAAPGHALDYTPPAPPKPDHFATTWAAKHSPAVAIHLLTQPKPAPPAPSVAPYRRGYGPVPVTSKTTYVDRHNRPVRTVTHTEYKPRPKGQTPAQVEEQQYRWAKRAQWDQGAARKLAHSMTGEEKREVLDPNRPNREYAAAHPRLPQLPWYERFNPVVRAGAFVDPLIDKALHKGAPAVGHYAADLARAAVNDIVSHAYGGTNVSSLRPAQGGWRTAPPVQAGAALPSPEKIGQALEQGGLGAAKMLTAGGAAVASMYASPGKTGVKIAEGGVGALRGLAQIPGLLVLAGDYRTPQPERLRLMEEVGKSFIDYYRDTYGPNATFADAAKHGKEDPFNSLADAIAVAAPGARITSLLKLMAGGEELGAAIRLTYRPAEARKLLLSVPGGAETRTATREWARSPLSRTLINRPYDLASRLLDRNPRLRRLPISQQRRAARLLDAQNRRQLRRLPAEAASLFVDAEEAVKEHPEYATTLATLMQKPKGFTDEEWLRAVIIDMKEMLDGRSFISPERETAGVKRLRNRIRLLEKHSEQGRVRRRARASRNIDGEQTRLADALDEINDQRQDALADMSELESSALPQEEKAAQRNELQAELRALNTQARVAGEELEGITVEQAPVEHPARTELREKAIENGDEPDHVDDTLAALDARARVWARQTGKDPGEWYEGLQTHLVEAGDVPSAALAQRAARGSHIPKVVYSKEKTAARLKSKLKPRKGTATGIPTTRTLWATTPDGTSFKLAGNITPADWVQRVLAVIPNAQARDDLARWYEHYEPMFRKAFGKDADRVMRGFAVSQANASPSSGLTAVLKVMDKLDRGEQIGAREISVVGQSIGLAVEDKEIPKFIAAKLSDFIDSLAGRSTRTWMDNVPEAGSPSAVDVHAIRDRGFIDNKLVKRLTGRGYQKGKHFKVEGRGAATGPLYERISEWYQEIADHLNDGEGFDGRTDWTPAQAQALGWSAIQMAHGVLPEGFAEAFANNTRRITFEVSRGPLGLGNDLTPAQTRQVAKSMEYHVRELVDDMPGLWLRDVKVGVGGWQQDTNINISVRVLGTAESVQAALTRFAKAFDQEWVQATREVTGKNSRATLLVDSPRFKDPRNRARFFAALNRIDPRLEGFMDYDVEGVPGLAIRTNSPSTSPKTAEKFKDRYRSAIEQAEAETGIEVHGSVRNMEMLTGGQHGEVAPIQTLAGSGGGLERRALDDPLAARIRGELESEIDRARRGEGPSQRGVTLNQAREGDILGAVQWLDTEPGKRILYLTPNANASTILHELVGHASEEMRSLYPQEFAKVEDEIGRPYADWTVDDHEKLARWAERYFHDGHAPTPELVVAMDRIKSWMRSIYGGMVKVLGKQLPVATRVLFDSYFGAYDDENVARVAVNMGREGWGKEDLQIQRYGGAEALTRAQLQQVKRSTETRHYKKTTDGMLTRLEELKMKGTAERPDVAPPGGPAPEEGAHSLAEGPLDEEQLNDWEAAQDERMLTEAEQQEVNQLSAEVLTRQAAEEVKRSTREKKLREKISDLETALERGIDNDAFQGALESMKWIAEDREQILREAFGDRYDEVFSHRRDLLADWLVERGLLKPDFERGTASYFPVTIEEPLARGVASGASPVVSRVLGKTKTDLLKLHKRNEMIAWQNGSWQADPAVLLEAHQRAMSYAYVSQMKQLFYDLGRPLTYAEAQELPTDVYLINPTGSPLGPELKSQLRSKTTTKDVHRLFDGNEGGDNRELAASIENYVKAWMIDPKDLPPGFDPTEIPSLRVIPKGVISLMMRPVRAQTNKAGTALDFATTMARWALIYGNVPGYMLTNGIGNVFFLLAQQGIKAPLMLKGLKIAYSDKRLLRLIHAEVGELPVQAALARGRNFSQSPGKIMHIESSVDRGPRTAAWVYEARRLGYTSAADMKRLIQSTEHKTMRDREQVAEFTNEYMVNFDRLGYWEKQNITRFVFVWPWVRGATAYPFWYAKMHPERAALAATAGSQMEQRRRGILGPVPDYYANLVPGVVHGTHAQVVNAGPIGTTSTAAEKLSFLEGLVAQMLGRAPDQSTRSLISLASPVLADLIELGTGRDEIGRQVPLLETLKDTILTDTIPGWRLGHALLSDDQTPRAFRSNRGIGSRAARTFIRINPQTVSIRWLNYQAQKRGETKTTQQLIDESVAKNQKEWTALVGGTVPYSQEIRKQQIRKVVFSEAEKNLQQQIAGRPDFEPVTSADGKTLSAIPALNDYQRAHLAYTVLQSYPSAGTSAIPSPDAILQAAATQIGKVIPPTSPIGLKIMGNYMSKFDKLNSMTSRISSKAKKSSEGKAIAKQAKELGYG